MGVAVMLEDAAAVLGGTIAALGIGATAVTGNVMYDAIATVTVSLFVLYISIFYDWMIHYYCCYDYYVLVLLGGDYYGRRSDDACLEES